MGGPSSTLALDENDWSVSGQTQNVNGHTYECYTNNTDTSTHVWVEQGVHVTNSATA